MGPGMPMRERRQRRLKTPIWIQRCMMLLMRSLEKDPDDLISPYYILSSVILSSWMIQCAIGMVRSVIGRPTTCPEPRKPWSCLCDSREDVRGTERVLGSCPVCHGIEKVVKPEISLAGTCFRSSGINRALSV